MTTLRDLLNDFAKEVLDLRADQPEGESIPDDDMEALLDETIHEIKGRLIG